MVGILLFEGTTGNLADASLPGSFYGPRNGFQSLLRLACSVSESSVDRIRCIPKFAYLYVRINSRSWIHQALFSQDCVDTVDTYCLAISGYVLRIKRRN